jgi:uncharacterized membrane protein YjdF
LGDDQARCKRPRPAVCSSATIERPSAAPSEAIRANSVFVEGNDSNRTILGLRTLMDEIDYTGNLNLSRRLELPLVMVALIAGAAFLTKMCYLSLAFNTLFVIVFLALFYFYVRARLKIRIPVVLLGLVFLALQVDALGNYFRMYGQQFGPMHYDEFAHMTVQVLVSPIIVWLVTRLLNQSGYRLPLKLTAFFAATIVFSLSAVYEIIELWDEVYFGGRRIWGPYDTATDLQWDLCGILVGTLFSCIMLRDTRDQLVPH